MTSIPGASAVINALAMSGLPTHKFLYLGYLPLKKGRKRLIASLKDYPYTIVLYEAPHRILRTLQEILDGLGDRHVSVCREMTKIYEEVFRGNLSDAIAYFKSKSVRGEFTVVLGAETAIMEE